MSMSIVPSSAETMISVINNNKPALVCFCCFLCRKGSLRKSYLFHIVMHEILSNPQCQRPADGEKRLVYSDTVKVTSIVMRLLLF